MVEVKRQKTKRNTAIQKSKLLTFALYFCFLTFEFCLSASACPGCKEALFEPGKISQNLATARGYALSIALLLGIPVVLMGTIAVLLVRARRKSLNNADLHAD